MIMTKVFDYTEESDDGKYKRINLDLLSVIWIHRIGPGIGLSAVEISKFFQTEGASYTGGNMAYTFVNTSEQIQQALPLDEKGAHARRFGNMYGIGFAQIGDFNKEPPKTDQWERAVDLSVELVPYMATHTRQMFAKLPEHLRYGLPVVGHGEVPGAYGSGKEQPHGSDACPGRYWNMDEFRQDVESVVRDRAAALLSSIGVRFTKER